ncbi:hypothetical protein MSAN_01158100 [Mycena sanguinolenta]|uniref:Uncharacterized protein n=1 Tax=Mycena sanguinolenta TaxID=230812 RepID=A0A8H6YLK5_9AGAR|nr:hypothetical protein MSAN_01158100 [Mycena sanguinolenta]
MRPLPSPPTSAASQSVKSIDSASFISLDYSTPLTAQSFVIRLPIGVELPKASSGAPRLLKARRREGRIFTHSPSSSVSSLDSSSSFGSILKAEFWIPPESVVSIPAHDETIIMPPTTPTTPKTKTKSKPANILIPRNAPIATVVSPTSPVKPPLVSPRVNQAPVAFPAMLPSEEVLCTSPLQSPLSPILPLSPLSPNRRIHTPNARIRKMAKLTRTLGENIPIELVFPGAATTSAPSVPSNASPAPVPKPTKRAKMTSSDSVAKRAIPPKPRAPLRPVVSPEWPLTPTPDCTVDTEAHARTAVGLHYALGLNSLPTRNAVPAHAALTVPKSPPPFSNVFTVDDVSWEQARRAVMGPRTSGKKAKRVVGGVHKAPADVTGRGTWRKKENTWSGEWNVEDMEELQVRLRRLRRL